jgi:hypothetical protein
MLSPEAAPAILFHQASTMLLPLERPAPKVTFVEVLRLKFFRRDRLEPLSVGMGGSFSVATIIGKAMSEQMIRQLTQMPPQEFGEPGRVQHVDGLALDGDQLLLAKFWDRVFRAWRSDRAQAHSVQFFLDFFKKLLGRLPGIEGSAREADGSSQEIQFIPQEAAGSLPEIAGPSLEVAVI